MFFYFDDLKLPRLTYNFTERQIWFLSKEHFVWIETLKHFYWKKVKFEGGGLDFIHISSSSLSLFWTQPSSDIIRGLGGRCMLSGAVRKSWCESDCEHQTCSCELKEKIVSASEMRPSGFQTGSCEFNNLINLPTATICIIFKFSQIVCIVTRAGYWSVRSLLPHVC